MKLDERRARYEALMAAVRKHDVRSWYQSFLAHLERVRSAEDPIALAFAGAYPRGAGEAGGGDGAAGALAGPQARSAIVSGWGPTKRVRCTGT